ncbi:MAG: hypothetical protein ACRENY_08820 [Candidatus Dormibacteria bacterium]
MGSERREGPTEAIDVVTGASLATRPQGDAITWMRRSTELPPG